MLKKVSKNLITHFKVKTVLHALFLFLSGCSIMPGIEGKGEKGTVKIMLTDFPLNGNEILEVNVTILGVDIQSSEKGWESFTVENQEYDLLDLQNGVIAKLIAAEMPPGRVNQIRLILSDVHNVLVQYPDLSTSYEPLIIPSGEETGIKINVNTNVVSGYTSNIVLDFDAELSVTFAAGSYILRPTINVASISSSLGILVFSEDFGSGGDSNIIEGWEEEEHPSRTDKCMVVDGSVLGERLARIYGEDILGVNHSFFKSYDMSKYSSGKILFWARRSDNWNPSIVDGIYFELFYNGSWDNPYTFYESNTSEIYSMIEIPLTLEMMETQLYFRFRNNLPDETMYLDIDNFELYGIK
jgi:hypothetical protein